MSMIEVRGKIHSQRGIKIYREKKKIQLPQKVFLLLLIIIIIIIIIILMKQKLY